MTKYLLHPGDFQTADDAAVTLADKREGAIRSSVRRGLATLGEAIDAPQVGILIRANDIAGVAGVLTGPRVTDALLEAYKPIADAYVEAAEKEAAARFGALVVYDPLQAAAALSGARQTFMGNILGPTADVVAEQLLNAVRSGADPEETAQALKAVIGLTPRQAAAVSNFRRLLEEGDRQALNRALRDRRFDSTVRAWADGTAKIDPAKVDAMVERYADKMLSNRASTIASNEAMQATTGGIRDAYVQAVKSGRLGHLEVRRHWQLVFDERLCAVCGSIPLLNPGGVGVLEPYLSLEGPVIAPRAHVNCRCSEKYVVDLSSVSANPFRLAS